MKSNSLFWEFRTPDTPTPSILYGTIHLGTPGCMVHWEKAIAYIHQYNRIFTESSVNQEAALYIQPFSLLEPGVRIHDFISKRRWGKMRQVFLKYCSVDIDQLKMLKPLFILSQLQASLLEASNTLPLDYRIWQTAENLGKHMMGVETPQEQVDILLQLDIGQQYLQLVKMSKKISKTRSKLQDIIAAYGTQDIQKLYKMSKSSLGKDRGTLISNRNMVMADRLISFHNREPSFFSFGAGHLYGGMGVLRLLKQKGAVIKPI